MRIGYVKSLLYGDKHESTTIVRVNGTWCVKGLVVIGAGSIISITTNACLDTGNGVRIGPSSKLCCCSRIIIGENVLSSWNVQIFDTDYHYLTDGTRIFNCHKAISIGNNVWIGNNTSIYKGSVIPNHTTIASNSLVNKELDNTPYCIYAGMPVRKVKEGLTRVNGFRTIESVLDDCFQITGSQSMSVNDYPDLVQYKKFNDSNL